MYHTVFQWGTSKEAKAQVIIAGLKNPTPNVSRATEEAEATDNTHITFNVFHLFTDADEQPADKLTEVAALDINSLLAKTFDISKGVLFNI